VAIGHKPNTDIFKDFITLDETGYIVNTTRKFKTNVEGVFVSGDAASRIPSGNYRCWNGLWLL
jgi:thioredoxin reductase (NADPH)